MVRKFFKYTFMALLLIALVIFLSDLTVRQSAKGKTFTSSKKISKNRVGLLLGTIKTLPNGWDNLYYNHRINAAVKLFKSGKIEYILVSGDNSREGYDEPTDMRDDLVRRGIPSHRIYLDYAGFRTLDSIVRAKEIFGQSKLTIISQPFHNERALFIAKMKGIEATGFNAKDVSMRYGLKVQVREKLARVKMMLDILIGKKPKFLGKKVAIG